MRYAAGLSALARPLKEKQVFELLGYAADRQNSTTAY